MAQWTELLKLNLLQGQLGQFYDRKFPRHIRHCLCLFIESQDWDSAAVDENKARICFQTLRSHLEDQCNRSLAEGNMLQGPDFPGMKDYLVRNFEESPLQLARVLSECLQEEKKVLSSASQQQDHSSPQVNEKWRVLDNRVNLLHRQTVEIEKKMSSLTNNHTVTTWRGREEFAADADGAVGGSPSEQLQTVQMLLVDVVNVLRQTEQIIMILTEVELPEWRQRQQMACIGSPVSTCLSHLQKWFTALAELTLHLHRRLQKLQEQSRKYKRPDLSLLLDETQKFTVALLTKLLTNALVVEKQPVMGNTPQRPLVIKTGVRFSVTVRFLVNLPEFSCLLKIKPFFDKDMEQTIQTHGLRQFELNKEDSQVMDVQTDGDGLVTEFVQMTLKEIKTRSTQHSLLVTEEFHVIKFATCLQFDGLKFNIEVSSLPLVVVSATVQIPAAWASVMWWNMLCTSEQQNLLLFHTPPPAVTWQQLSQVLSWQFLSVGQRGLDEEQLSMLRDKIVDPPDGLVHWSKFKSDTVWTWIDAILNLIKGHLLDLWRNGYIMGFVSRRRTQVLLQEKESGTFLLRFSESIKDGAITFSWVEHSAGETHVHAVEPYTKNDLKAMSLVDTLRLYSLRAQGNTMNPLLYLYPHTPRDTAFGPYYSSERPTPKKDVSGYIDRRLIPFSVYPTPPSSPPGDMAMELDLELDLDLQECVPQPLGGLDRQLLEELVQGLLDSSESFDQLK